MKHLRWIFPSPPVGEGRTHGMRTGRGGRLATTLILFSSILLAENHHDHESHSDHDAHNGHDEHQEAYGSGKAIAEVKEDGNRFKLNDAAIETLGIQSSTTKKLGPKLWEVPLSSLVYFQDEVGIFSREGDWFEMVHVKVLQKTKTHAQITPEHPHPIQNVVIAGAPLLRIAHLQASGQGGHGHVH